ncbi:MAG: PD-(D/E)XK nuclease family protein, partial [Luminiphilus sp.]|nr:PD-(D/E)XK nuclease family protein [Luminiphilus sp.]
ILTPTHRYARDLSQRLRDKDTAVSLMCSQILSVDRWAETTWRQLAEQGHCEPRRLLTTYERQAVWRDIVASEAESRSAEFALIQPQVASQLAQRCREIMKTHRVPWSTQGLKSIFSVEFDTRIFHEWLSSCDRLLRQKGWIFPEDVYDIITETTDVKSGEVWLLNHPAPTPALKAAIDNYFESSTWFELPKWGEPQPVEQFESKAQELKAAAVWALETVSAPDSSCAIILSNYQEDRPELEYRLREAFQCLDNQYTALPVTFSRGLELSKVPVFRDLLLLLRLLESGLKRNDVAALFRSPYLVGRQSKKSFATIIDRLFAKQTTQLSIADIRSVMTAEDREHRLLSSLLQARDARLHSRRESISEWRTILIELIEQIGWPNQTALDSLEYQQVSQLSNVLDAVEINPALGHRIGITQFIQELEGALKGSLFQPKTDQHRVTVLALQDAIGLSFDAVRVVGASSQHLPNTVAPLAFIPQALKRRFTIDVDDMVAEQRRVGSMLESLRSGTKSFEMTMCSQIDGASILPSIFCGEVAKTETNVSVFERWVGLRQKESLELLAVDETTSLARPHASKGGTGLLQSQADCGVQAWLKHRVGLKPLKTSDIALNALDRGTTLHRALELLTKRLNTLQAFLSCSDADANSICEEAARGAVDHLDSDIRQRVGTGILRLEEARLKEILLTWIDFERTRTLQFSVEHREYDIEWEHNGLQLKVKADRIDRLESGDAFIIDYKSSPVSSMASWVSPQSIRLPQLPAYAIATKRVGAIGIAAPKRKEPELLIAGAAVGISSVDAKAHNAMEKAGFQDTAALLEHWDSLLTNLVDDYLNGSLTLPENSSVCRFCDFHTICRIRLTEDERDTELEGDD